MLNSLARSRPSWLLAMVTGVAVPVLLLLSGDGPSKAWGAAAPASQSVNQDSRIRELEERIKILELEQETLDRRLRLELERNGRSFDDIDHRLRALEAHAPTPGEIAAATQPDKAAVVDAMCREPF